MSMARTQRRLIAARRYANHQYIPGQSPLSVWTTMTSIWDSPSVLRAAARLAHHRYRHQLADMTRSIIDDGSDCGGWTWDPPCGGCTRCQRDMAVYYADRYRRDAHVARARLQHRESKQFRHPALPLQVGPDDLPVEPGCRCAVVLMAPCSWCEHGGQYDAAGQPATPSDGEL